MKKYMQAVFIWVLIIPLAILNGGLRETVLNKLGKAALPLSGILLSAMIFGVALLLIPKIKNCQRKDYFIFGGIWFVLTNLFELIMFVKEGGGFADLLKSYYFFTGNLWVLVVLITLFAPVAVIKKSSGRQEWT